MKYFTKYLPVEGEIHSGGKYWNKQHQCADDIGDEIHVAMLRIGAFKPAKLFLCSRDIKKRDIMTSQYGGNEHPAFVTHNCHDIGCVKVIGEISEGAKWVTEGMEFERNQLHAMYGDDTRKMVSSLLDQIAIDNPEQLGEYKEFRKFILVKCPTCGHCH